MKLLIVCALALAYTIPSVLGIFRGKNATKSQFPYQARIYAQKDLDSGDCSASLIARNWLLTAAHCIYRMDVATIYLGTTHVSNGATTRYVRSEALITHPQFGDHPLRNDIALVRIPAVTLTEYIKIVQLPANNTKSDYVGRNVTASGWGRNGNAESATLDLQFTTFEVITNQDCQKLHSIPITSEDLCAKGKNNSSTCKGDSGAPLLLTNTNTQVGIASWGHMDGCDLGYPIIFTRISEYLQWINEKTGIPIQQS